MEVANCVADGADGICAVMPDLALRGVSRRLGPNRDQQARLGFALRELSAGGRGLYAS